MTRPQRDIARVWDSCVVADYLAGNPRALPHARPIVEAARRGEVQLWLSLFVHVEVAYLEGMSGESSERTIMEFLNQDYIVSLMIDPFVSDTARKLIRQFHIPGKDAIHVASAIRYEAPIFETFDKPLMRKLQQPDIGNLLKGLLVREPLYEGQRQLGDLPLV